MSFEDCVREALSAGLTRDTAAELDAKRQRFLRAGFDSAEAESRAFDSQLEEMNQQQVQTMLQTLRTIEAVGNVTSHSKGVSTGIMSLLGRDITSEAKYSNIDYRARAIMSTFTARVAEAMEAMRTTMFGLRQDTALARDVVRELFQTRTGNGRAARFAQSFSEVFEDARLRFNAAGGAIAKREDWGMPQFHDFQLVARAGRDNWRQTIEPLLDRSKMLDEAGVPLSDADFDALLDDVYETVSTDGLSKLQPGAAGGKKLANRHNDRRFLIFRDGDAWLQYHDQFGRQNLYLSMMDHLEGMAHDIANLEILGPNPQATYRYLRDLARKDGTKGVRLAAMDALYNVVSGRADDTASTRLADTSAAIRNWLTSARLGSAMLSAVSDLAFFRQATAWNGLSSVRAMGDFLRTLNPARKADRLRAVKMGLVAEHWMTRALAANRFTEVTGAGFSAKAADLTMRLSGLSAWTDAGQKAVGLELMTTLAENVNRSLDEILSADPELGRLLSTYVTDEDWNIIRTSDLDEHDGVGQVFVPNILARSDIAPARAQDAATHLLEAMHALTNKAVPSPDARARAVSTGGTQAGTVRGEAIRFAFQFKGFPVSVVLQHVYDGIYRASAGQRLSYLAGITVGATVMGALAVQLKEISKGRDPRAMDNPDFWVSAFTQGGGAGIFGDFAYAGIFGSNRFGGSFAETLAGPAAGATTDALRLTLGQLGETVEGEDPNLGRDAASALQNYMPVASSLWYTRLAYERLVVNQLELMADPSAPSRYRRDRRKRAREQGQGYWWGRGSVAPDRAPDLDTALPDD